ncbi:MAG TPA: hypothetical protein DHW14_00500 [Clostridiales bacterium]|nr:hypothetical protein [Clostridiales bacterium]
MTAGGVSWSSPSGRPVSKSSRSPRTVALSPLSRATPVRSAWEQEAGGRRRCQGGEALARGFWSGVLAGSIIGGIVGALFAPSMNPETRDQLMERGRELRRKAELLVRRAERKIDEALEEQ